jgi:hypothetical protein
MHKNGVWLAFLSVLILITFWFCGKAGFELYDYLSLSRSSNIQHIDWKVQEVKSNHFVICATYDFTVDGIEYNSNTVLSSIYPNYWAAHSIMQDLMNETRIVWYNPHNVSYSALEKSFPMKASVSAIILISLLVYFIFLGMYVGKLQKTKV